MRDKKNVCFSASRICHHDDYYLFISKFDDVINVKSLFCKLKFLFSRKTIYYLDIDKLDLVFTPLILLRSIWGGKGIGMSVRTEYLLEEISFYDFLSDPINSKFFHVKVKQLLFISIKFCSRTKLISIHKGHPKTPQMSKYVNSFIYDPQLWDLKFLNFTPKRPIEVKNILDKRTILIAGSFNEQRSRSEFLKYLNQIEEGSSLQFVIAGKIGVEDFEFLHKIPNILIINRFISNEELYYLFLNTEIVYCFYTNNRPSGFFGRALQLGKKIIIRRNGYLHVMFGQYPNLIPIEQLSELNNDYFNSFSSKKTIGTENLYDDYDNFKSLIRSVL